MSLGHVFNLSLRVAKALNLSLALDRTFEYEHRIINVTSYRGGIKGRFRSVFSQVAFKTKGPNVYIMLAIQ